MIYSYNVRYLRISPKKLQQVSALVSGTNTNKALDILAVQKQKGASMLYQAIKSALNNAAAANIDLNSYRIVGIACNKGPVFMRRWVRLRGTTTPKRKYTTHARIDFGEAKKTTK